MNKPVALLISLVLSLLYVTSAADESAVDGRPAERNSPEGSFTRGDSTQNSVAEKNGIILLVTAPERWVIGKQFHVRVLLINHGKRPVVFTRVDDWYELTPALVDADGRAVPLTQFGRGKLGKRESFRRRFRSVLEPGHFHSWKVDLSQAFRPEPGLLALSMTVEYRFGDEIEQALELKR